MPALQVRDFPQELYDELRDCAARNHRSIAQQTIVCVEEEIRRSKAVAAQKDAGDSSGNSMDVSVPPEVHEAAMRARAVDAFEWANVFQIETEEAREARRARWEELRKRFADLAQRWNAPAPTCEELSQMIREGRDERTDQIMANVEGFLAAEGRG